MDNPIKNSFKLEVPSVLVLAVTTVVVVGRVLKEVVKKA
jgi:hypothetical protein